MRFRDLVLQVRRFLKFAPKGTSSVVLAKEARIFHGRLALLKDIEPSEVRKLQRDLEKIFIGKK
jgi:hypothetical protein